MLNQNHQSPSVDDARDELISLVLERASLQEKPLKAEECSSSTPSVSSRDTQANADDDSKEH